MWFKILLLCSVAIATEAGNCGTVSSWKWPDKPDGNTYIFTGLKFESQAANNVKFDVYIQGSKKTRCRSVKKGELKPIQGWIYVPCAKGIEGQTVSLSARGLQECGEKIYAVGSLKKVPEVTTSEKLVCESKSLSLSCPAGRVLNIVEASYGRHDGKTCPHKSIKTTNCNACASMDKVKQMCDNRRSCRVAATNSVFGDPCKGTYKYLKVKSQCVSPGSGACGAAKKTNQVCEHKTVSISCPVGKKIKVDSASYGGSCAGKKPKDSSCHACSSLAKVKQSCEGKQKCSVKASNGVFGDPCYGTGKRLKVVYSCC